MKLNEYKECFNLSLEQFISQHNIRSEQIKDDLSYEKIVNVTRVELPESQFFFFKDGKLKMIYISGDSLSNEVWDEFKNLNNASAPESIVRSRAGKTSNQNVFAKHGISASIAKGDVDFIEIFPPCSLQEYLDQIYREPPVFIR